MHFKLPLTSQRAAWMLRRHSVAAAVPDVGVHAGLKGDPHVDKMFQSGANIQDDPFKKGNSKGRVTFATSGLLLTLPVNVYAHA